MFVQMQLCSGKIVVFGQGGCKRAKWLNSGKRCFNRAKVAIFGHCGCLNKVVIFGQSGSIWTKWLYSGKSSCIRVKMVVFGQIGCIGAKWLFTGKVVVFWQKLLY